MRLRLFRGSVLCAAIAALVVPGSGLTASPPPGTDEVHRVQIWTLGKGTVASLPARIACPSLCIGTFPVGARVSFIARAAKGWKFARWYHGCAGTKPKCTVAMSDGEFQIVAAQFDPR